MTFKKRITKWKNYYWFYYVCNNKSINLSYRQEKTIEDVQETEPINLVINIDGQEIE